MRILFVATQHNELGHVNEYVQNLTTHLQQHGHQVRVLTHATHLRKHILEYQPTIISAHTLKALKLSRVASVGLPTKVVYTAHPNQVASRLPLPAKLFARSAAHIIATSNTDRQSIISTWGVKPGSITTVRKGLPEVTSALQAHPTCKPPRLVLDITCMEPHHHPTLGTLLRNLASLEYSLDLLGPPHARSHVTQLITENNLHTRVRYTEGRAGIAELLAQSQAFVQLGTWSETPQRVIAAMRAGLPVIASASGAASEYVIENKTGFLVPLGDDAVLAQRLELFIQNPNTRLFFGNAGRTQYETHFTASHFVERTMAVYSDVTA